MAALEKRSISIGTSALLTLLGIVAGAALAYGVKSTRLEDTVELHTKQLGDNSAVIDRHTGELARLDKELDRTKDAAAVTNKRLDELLEEVRGTRADIQRAVWKVK